MGMGDNVEHAVAFVEGLFEREVSELILDELLVHFDFRGYSDRNTLSVTDEKVTL